MNDTQQEQQQFHPEAQTIHTTYAFMSCILLSYTDTFQYLPELKKKICFNAQ